MIKLENTEVLGWEHAIRGMRNPMNSWEKSDSGRCQNFKCGYSDGIKGDELVCPLWKSTDDCPNGDCIQLDMSGAHDGYIIGPNDLGLMKRLRNAGTDHRKFMRMIVVYVDITAPLYWWKEFDTYRVGVAPNPTDIEMNSCSTMHKIHAKEFTLEDFSCERLLMRGLENLKSTINELNYWRNLYLNGGSIMKSAYSSSVEVPLKDKTAWWQMIQLLPSSYNQKRTVMLNYEVLANIYKSRKGHKLDEWRELCKWIEGLPYAEIITGMTESEKMLWVGEKIHEGFKDGLEHPDPAIIEKWNSVSGGYPVTSEDIIANAMAEAYGFPPIDPKKLDPAERTTDTGKAMKDIMDKLNEKG